MRRQQPAALAAPALAALLLTAADAGRVRRVRRAAAVHPGCGRVIRVRGRREPGPVRALAAGSGHSGGAADQAAVRCERAGQLPGEPAAHEPALAAAMTADGDFELAYLYAQYTGGRDDRWTVYASPKAVRTFRADLAQPSVTRHSFRGRVRYFAIRAYPDPATHGAVDVTGCFDDAGAVTTSLRTGQPDGPAVPANQHYFRYTDIVARRGGRWVVIGNYPALYYPQAKECKP